jgi:hypothetical protein
MSKGSKRGPILDISKEFTMIELKNWRKKPTMRVSDMIQNKEKTRLENLYIAEKKYALYKSGLSFKEIRDNLNSTYGGFDMEGNYFQNK